MRITPTTQQEINRLAAGQPENAAAVQSDMAGATGKAAAQASSYTPSADLLHLTALAKQEPATRPEVVAAVALRVAQGYYATSASAAQTANALLNAID